MEIISEDIDETLKSISITKSRFLSSQIQSAVCRVIGVLPNYPDAPIYLLPRILENGVAVGSKILEIGVGSKISENGVG